MTGAEIAWRTLNMERVEEPCIVASWMMKRDFFRHYAGVEDIYADPVRTVVDAFANAGANLNPQFIMPSPGHEHIATGPESVVGAKITVPKSAPQHSGHDDVTPESVRDEIDAMPDPDTVGRDFDLDGAARKYAEPLLKRREMSRDRTLFISGFGCPSVMGGYTRWGYDNYLAALVLYPESFRKYFALGGENGRLHNCAAVEAVRKYDLAPFVYSGDDICFNDGPVCSPALLDDIYFPAMRRAFEPLLEADVRIIWHCDGDIRRIVPQLLEAGVSGFQGFQEEAGVSLEGMTQLRTRWGKKPILWGCMSVTTTMPFGTVEEVKGRVEECFRIAAPGGGFCLASTSSILPEAPLENIVALFEHGKKFGREFLKSL